MLGGADNSNGELPSYNIGANSERDKVFPGGPERKMSSLPVVSWR